MRRTLLIVCAMVAAIAAMSRSAAASPMPVIDSSLQLWLNADDITGLSDGQIVSTWNDSSTLSPTYNATAVGAGKEPTYVASAGNPGSGVAGVRFDAIDDGMFTALNVTSGDYSIFALFNYESNVSTIRRAVQGSNNWLIGPYANQVRHYASGWVSDNPGLGTVTVTQGAFYATEAVRDDGGALPGFSRFFVNGVDTTTNSAPAGYPGIINLGASGGFTNEPLGGVLTDVLVYNRLLTPTETAQVNDYLQNKLDALLLSPPNVNAALGKPIIASSGNYPGFDPFHVTDGNTNEAPNAPISYWLGRENTRPEFFILDLLTEQPVDEIVLFNTHNRQFNDRWTADFTIMGSLDNVTYFPILADTLAQTTGQANIQGQSFLLGSTVTVRYLRFDAINGGFSPVGGVGLNEIQVFDRIPEPATVTMGLFGLLALARRRKRAA